MLHAPDMNLWKGRVDEDSGTEALRWHQVINPYKCYAGSAGIVFLGVCTDEGVQRNQGRSGAEEGPTAIRKAMANQAYHLRRPLYDAGDLYCENRDLESLQEQQAQTVKQILEDGHFPLVLGGGHEIAYGSFAGLLSHVEAGAGEGEIGVIYFDAHFDLRQAPFATSGTPFLQIARLCRNQGRQFQAFCLGISEVANTGTLFHSADALGVSYLKDEELTCLSLAAAEERLEAFLQSCRYVHLSIDLDVLPPSVAPGVSAPSGKGVPLEYVEHLLNFIRSEAGGKIRVADIAECNPHYDIDGRTARVAARLVHLLAREIDE